MCVTAVCLKSQQCDCECDTVVSEAASFQVLCWSSSVLRPDYRDHGYHSLRIPNIIMRALSDVSSQISTWWHQCEAGVNYILNICTTHCKRRPTTYWRVYAIILPDHTAVQGISLWSEIHSAKCCKGWLLVYTHTSLSLAQESSKFQVLASTCRASVSLMALPLCICFPSHISTIIHVRTSHCK